MMGTRFLFILELGFLNFDFISNMIITKLKREVIMDLTLYYFQKT
jgi:hypothetical protein